MLITRGLGAEPIIPVTNDVRAGIHYGFYGMMIGTLDTFNYSTPICVNVVESQPICLEIENKKIEITISAKQDC